MHIDVTYTPQELRRLRFVGATVVVIDVIRAATTVATALANGCAGVIPVVSVAAARRTASSLTGERPLLGGERGGLRIPGFDLGNSPSEYTLPAVGGRLVVFTTSNGTATLHAATGAEEVLVAAPVNLEAVVQHAYHAGQPVVFACSGRGRRPVLDDTVVAGLMAARLTELAGADARPTDAAQIAMLAAAPYAADPLRALRASASARERPDFEADLQACAQRDVYHVVPVLREGRLVRA